MLATILLSAAWMGNALQATPEPKAFDVQLLEFDLGSREAERKMADGTYKVVSVSQKLQFGPNTETDYDGPERVYRDVRVRPERLGESFSMNMRLETIEVDDLQIYNLIGYLDYPDKGPEIGMQLAKAVRLCVDYTRKRVEGGSVQIDPNKDIQGGGWTSRTYGHRLVPYMVSPTLVSTYFDGAKNVTTVSKLSGVHVGTVWLPQEAPLKESFYPDGQPSKELQEEIGGGTFQPVGMGWPVQGFLPQLPDRGLSSIGPAAYVSDVVKENGGKPFADRMLELGYTAPKMVEILTSSAFEGTDMNYLNVPELENPCNMDFDAPAGTMWVPSNGAYQSMVTGVNFNYRSLGFDLWATINPGFSGQQANSMRVLCMNMEKKEPAAGVKYFPYRPKDPVTRRLAQDMNVARFRGPWDQARMWIYADRATIEELNKRLVQQIPASGYLMALADVDWAGGMDERMRKDSQFVRPDFLAGNSAPAYATNFLLENLDEFHSKKAGDWLKKNANVMFRIAGSEMDDFDRAHLKLVFGRMLNFKAKEDRLAALQVLKAGSDRFGFLAGQLGGGRSSLYSGNRDEIDAALDLVESGLLSAAQDAMAYLAVKGPNDQIKQRAQKLIKES